MEKTVQVWKLSFLLFAALLVTALPAYADVRLDAMQAVEDVLKRGEAAQAFPEDVKNLEAVYEMAQRHYADNDLESAERLYLLVLQKAQVVRVMIKGRVHEMPVAVVEVPPVTPYEAFPAVSPAVPTEVQPSVQTGDIATPQPEQAAAEKSEDDVDSNRLVGTKGVYTVVKGDSVRLVAAKLGVSQSHLRNMNGLDAKASLKVGQKLAYNNRKIIPQYVKNGIIVNIPDRTLYYFQRGELVTSLPVAVGSATKNEKYIWQTPVGKFKVTAKMKDPTWTVPPSIQTEMEEQGKDVITSIPPGPENPLGKYAIRTSIPGILIHSTTKPASIYSFSSHGCIRLAPSTMEDFFPQVKVNTNGEIIYKPVKLAVTENGKVFLEVHHDVYNKTSNLMAEARQLVEKGKLGDQIDWEKLKTVVRQKKGMVEDISL